MSFIDELLSKKKKLKSCQTVVTSPTGSKYVEKRTEYGEVERTKLDETSAGFVVDEKLDLQVAEILEYLYLSSQDPAQDSDLLVKHGITHVLSVGVEILTPVRCGSVRYLTVDLLDEPGVDLFHVLDICFNFINEAKAENIKNKVLVHCNAGYSRAPSVVAAYLMKTFGYSLTKAINMIKEKRMIKPNEGFMKQLMEFEKFLALHGDCHPQEK